MVDALDCGCDARQWFPGKGEGLSLKKQRSVGWEEANWESIDTLGDQRNCPVILLRRKVTRDWEAEGLLTVIGQRTGSDQIRKVLLKCFYVFIIYFLAVPYGLRDLSFLNLGPQQWKRWVLTTGQPEHSQMSCFHNIKLKLKEVNTISEVSVDLGLKPGDRVGSLISQMVASVSLCKVTRSAEKLDPESRRVVERSGVGLQGKTIIMLTRLITGCQTPC